MTQTPARPASGGGLHRYALLVSACTFLLVIAGALVTSTGSALAVPDWPLSFGQVFPRMEGGVLFEHGHRLIATTVGLLTVVLALWTSRTEPRPWVRALGWTLVGVVVLYAQILLGAIVRHTGAGLAIPDFPLAFGRLVPAFTNPLIVWQFAHRVGALVTSVMVAWTAASVLRRATQPFLLLPAALLLVLLALQILLGALTIWTLRAVIPTTAHVATGSLLFSAAVVLAVRVHRLAEGPTHRGPEAPDHDATRAAATAARGERLA